MANAPVSGEYPKEHQTPALTQPFAKEVVGFPLTAANLKDVNHPINIRNISGKSRGATVLLADDTVWMALGHKASDAWKQVGEGGGSGGDAVKSVNGVGPDETGDVKLTLTKGTVTSVNGVEPDNAGAVKINVVKTINGAGPDADGNINVAAGGGAMEFVYHSDPVLTITDASNNKFYVLNGTGEQSVTFGAVTKTIQASFVPASGRTAKLAQGTATEFACEGDWAQVIPAGKVVKLINTGNFWVVDRPLSPTA